MKLGHEAHESSQVLEYSVTLTSWPEIFPSISWQIIKFKRRINRDLISEKPLMTHPMVQTGDLKFLSAHFLTEFRAELTREVLICTPARTPDYSFLKTSEA